MRSRLLCVVGFLILLPCSVFAQPPTPVTATSGVAFNVTPELHAAATGYRVDVTCGTAAPIATSVGKPTPAANGDITVKPLAVLGTIPVSTSCTAKAAALTPTGELVSAASLPFNRLPPPPPLVAPGAPRIVN